MLFTGLKTKLRGQMMIKVISFWSVCIFVLTNSLAEDLNFYEVAIPSSQLNFFILPCSRIEAAVTHCPLPSCLAVDVSAMQYTGI